MGRGDDRAVRRHDVEKIETVGGGERRRLVDERRTIRSCGTEIDRRAAQHVARSHPLHARGDIVALSDKFTAALGDQRRGPLRVERLERAPRAGRHGPCREHHCGRHHGADEREQPSAERHGLSILIHTVLKSQAPDGSTAWPFQDSTCGPSA